MAPERTDAGSLPGDDRFTVQRLREDGEARIEFLLEADVLVEGEDGTIDATDEFENTRGIYVDSYRDASDEQIHRTVADLFGVSVERAADRVAELDVDAWDLATYLAVESDVDADLPADVLVQLASIAVAAGEASVVPADMQSVPDDHRAFVARQEDVVVFVFATGCDPCQAMKSEMDAIRERAPDGVQFAGADGSEAPDFRRTHDIEVAPTVLVFADGSLVHRAEGYTDPEELGEVFASVY